MKIVVWFAAAGAIVGAVVAVIAHFLLHTLPHTFEVTGLVDESGRGTESLGTPLIHPSWWPVLPSAIAGGLVVGGIIGLALQRSGFALVQRDQTSDPQPTEPGDGTPDPA